MNASILQTIQIIQILESMRYSLIQLLVVGIPSTIMWIMEPHHGIAGLWKMNFLGRKLRFHRFNKF
jgi:hypothetical protein